MTSGSKDTWIDFVRDAETDLFIITTTGELQGNSAINSVISRIKQGSGDKILQFSLEFYSLKFLFCTMYSLIHALFISVPQRLINTQCGADYDSTGSSSNSFIDYIEPGTIISYRLHPNYFFSTDSNHVSKVKVNVLLNS